MQLTLTVFFVGLSTLPLPLCIPFVRALSQNKLQNFPAWVLWQAALGRGHGHGHGQWHLSVKRLIRFLVVVAAVVARLFLNEFSFFFPVSFSFVLFLLICQLSKRKAKVITVSHAIKWQTGRLAPTQNADKFSFSARERERVGEKERESDKGDCIKCNPKLPKPLTFSQCKSFILSLSLCLS